MYGFFGKKDYDFHKVISSAEWNIVQHQKKHFDLLQVQSGNRFKAKVMEDYKDVINFKDVKNARVISYENGEKYLNLNFGSKYDQFKSGSLVYLASFITA